MTNNVFSEFRDKNGKWLLIQTGLSKGTWHLCRSKYGEDTYTYCPDIRCPACETLIPDSVLVTKNLLGD